MDEHYQEQDENRILLVDDEASLRQVLEARLGERYVCVGAGNAQEAVQTLSEQQFAVAILDVQMPGLSGIELLRKVLTDFPDMVVIMASGVDRTQRVRDALRLGAFDYLLKPIDLDVLELTVERALRHRTLLRDGERYKRDLEIRNQELASQKAELQRLQAQLVHNEKMASVGQLAAGIAHELNNPVAFIHSNMEGLSHYVDRLRWLLALYDSAPFISPWSEQISDLKRSVEYDHLLPDLTSMIADCHEGAARVRDIVLNLRTFSRLDEAEVKTINIHDGMDATIRLLSQYYNSNRISLKRDYADLPLVDCYAGQLNQVWMNLLTNAAQAIGEGPGEVKIETKVEGEGIAVRISDTGKGISEEHLRRIFDPFFTTKAVGEGTGLGLSISYGIIERHGGTITVDSDIGKGTTFTTLIPLKPNPPSPQPSARN